MYSNWPKAKLNPVRGWLYSMSFDENEIKSLTN